MTTEQIVGVAHARHTDLDTSHAAAASIAPISMTRTREAILRFLRVHDRLDYPYLIDLFGASGPSAQSIRSRCKELRDAGLIEVVPDVFTLSPSGRKQRVFTLTREGRDTARTLNNTGSENQA